MNVRDNDIPMKLSGMAGPKLVAAQSNVSVMLLVGYAKTLPPSKQAAPNINQNWYFSRIAGQFIYPASFFQRLECDDFGPCCSLQRESICFEAGDGIPLRFAGMLVHHLFL